MNIKPDHLIGVTKMDGIVMFLIVWKNIETADFVETQSVYERYPQFNMGLIKKRLLYITL
jgi:hypothetical protein